MDCYKTILDLSLLLDLETAPDGSLLKIGAVSGQEKLQLKGKFKPSDVVQTLNRLCNSTQFVLGHNILDHDLPTLKAQYPNLLLHDLPVIDTLFLSPIAFPKNPYHHLIKDYKLVHTERNNPVADALTAAALFCDQFGVIKELKDSNELFIRFIAWAFAGIMGALFRAMEISALSDHEARTFSQDFAARYGCGTAAQKIDLQERVPLAYALSWLRVAGANSVLPPWVRHRFPESVNLVRQLREIACDNPSCAYCRINHNPQAQLQHFFGFEDFRAEPSLPDGGSLQEAIVRSGMNNEPILAILPTGGGKSLCYQIPALVRNQRRGVLSIVISPLQALMKDQVDNLNQLTGYDFAAALYGMLTPPERGNVFERTRLGDIALLYVSPEQMRNASFRKLVQQREIACWVFDEAHCLSRWGHSFRPDYLYASRFIRELAGDQHVECPPVACFTATAKRDVIEEILQHFQTELGQELKTYDGGAERTNLNFEVQMVNSAEKKDRVLELLEERVPNDGASVVYCATRSRTEEMAEWLQRSNLSAEAFHAGLEAPEKKRIQDGFIAGNIDHICATNAFGMGIDKENVRLVVHADVPGSLENYLQEAGRAGRDRKAAQCVLLYDEKDIETQFSFSASSRLTRNDIAQILKGLRRTKQDENNTVVITSGEILRDEEVETQFDTEDPMAATKVSIAVSVLERGGFVERNENRTNVIQVRPLTQSLAKAYEKIHTLNLSETVEKQWKEIMEQIFYHDPDQTFSADELAELPSMAINQNLAKGSGLRHDTLPVLRILNDMVKAGLVKKDTLLSAHVKVRCSNASDKILSDICALELAMIDLMSEHKSDTEGWMVLSLRRLNQRLNDDGHSSAPESLRRLLGSLAMDGQGLAGRQGSIALKYRDKDHYGVKLQRSWSDIRETAKRRQEVASIVLNTIIAKVPGGANGEHLVEFGESDLLDALKSDMFILDRISDPASALERGLLFLHEQGCIILRQGLAVFRSAMTISILPGAKGRRFTDGDFSSLKEHYRERNFQIHVMNRYASLGLDKIQDALNLVLAYFTMDKIEFVKRYFPGDEEMLERATSAESYQSIVDELNNSVQISVVSAKTDRNMLVLAGPGSGKTRVIAHRCAYLLRVERVRPREVLVLCFNRAAATNLRERIFELLGRDAAGVTVQTYHGLAMRLAGVSLAAQMERRKETMDLDSLIPKVTAMLCGECDIPGLERDEMRERLLAGYRHILIDEYQDIDESQYEMISAIAGRTLDSTNDDAKLSILAVGDDDQSIYAFRGANVRFIRRFKEDYNASLHYLVENYRSTRNIINVSNQLIALNRDRMKTEHPIQINKARKSEPPGALVRIIWCPDALSQARHVLQQIGEIDAVNESIAVLSRTNDELNVIRAALESAGIPSSTAAERRNGIPLHRLREFQALVSHIKGINAASIAAEELRDSLLCSSWYDTNNPWYSMLDEFLVQWKEETNNYASPLDVLVEYLYESVQEYKRFGRSDNLVYLFTVYAAKGLEFDHVFILGNWTEWWTVEKQEEERRPYYVGMTRARKTLTLYELESIRNPYSSQLQGENIERCDAGVLLEPSDAVLSQCYTLLDLTSFWIDYPAIAQDSGRVRLQISKLQAGAAVSLVKLPKDSLVSVIDPEGCKIGILSKAVNREWEHRLDNVLSARVHSIVIWRKDFSDPITGDYPEEWEVPLLEVVWTK